MLTKFLSIGAAAMLLVQSGYSQSSQAKAGDLVSLSEGITIRVTKAAKSPFGSVKVKGEPLVVVLELDAGKKNARLGYKLGTDAAWSDIYLEGGDKRFGPRAVVEDFSSWGNDNDKEVEVLDPKDKTVGASLQFRGKGSLYLLFDVPSEQARTQKKLTIVIETIESTAQEHTVVVTL